MRVFSSLLPRARHDKDPAETAVVIDVLRATSVMAVALEAGATQIVTCREVEEATSLARTISPAPLLCGERGCRPIDGFDLGNSPAEYVSSRVSAKTLILTTTNGTRAIESATGAARMITASFLNLSAVIESLGQSESVHLVCAGTEGEITAEDVLLAGAILDICALRYQSRFEDDESMLAHQLWQAWFPVEREREERIPTPSELSRRLRETRGGRNLLRVGYAEDLDRCAAIDSIRAVPQRVSQSPASFQMQAI